jgi:tetratricopeptide (TPR) repeat protein
MQSQGRWQPKKRTSYYHHRNRSGRLVVQLTRLLFSHFSLLNDCGRPNKPKFFHIRRSSALVSPADRAASHALFAWDLTRTKRSIIDEISEENCGNMMTRGMGNVAPKLLLQAMKLVNEQRPERAEEVLRRLLQTQPDHADAWWLLGRALTQQGRSREGIEAHSRAAHFEPDRAVFHESLGVLLIQTGEVLEGKTALTKAMNLDSEALRPSEYTFGKLIESDRENALLWYGLGIVLEIQGKTDMSLKAMSRAHELDSSLANYIREHQE